MSFRQTRNFEFGNGVTFDGGILELSTDGGTTYNNVTSAAVGGSFTSGGYNCTIFSGFSNPLGGQAGWCAAQATYQTSTLILPGTLSGQTIRLRWRAGWDDSTAAANPNWRIDTFTLARPADCSAFTSTTTAIVSDSPDPSNVNQNFTVTHSIVSAFTETSFSPSVTGNVTVTDGVDSCTGTVAAGQCVLALTTAGNRTLRAFYSGDGTNAAAISGGNSHQVNVVTAADASISGRVLAQNGTRSVANATITMIAQSGNIRTARTNYLGYYNFNEVGSGQSYMFRVNSKGYTFLPQAVTINQSLTGLNFVAQNQPISSLSLVRAENKYV